METATVTIPRSKSKILLWLVGAIAFVILGGWLLFTNPIFHNALLDNPWFTKTAGLLSFVFFAMAIYFFLHSLMAKGPGLVIDDTGLQDFSSATSAPEIFWKDIEQIETLTIQSQKIILFKVSNPQTYIRQAKGFKRKMMELNYKWYGTPLSISANGLRISFQELLLLVTEKYEKYGNNKI